MAAARRALDVHRSTFTLATEFPDSKEGTNFLGNTVALVKSRDRISCDTGRSTGNGTGAEFVGKCPTCLIRFPRNMFECGTAVRGISALCIIRHSEEVGVSTMHACSIDNTPSTNYSVRRGEGAINEPVKVILQLTSHP